MASTIQILSHNDGLEIYPDAHWWCPLLSQGVHHGCVIKSEQGSPELESFSSALTMGSQAEHLTHLNIS